MAGSDIALRGQGTEGEAAETGDATSLVSAASAEVSDDAPLTAREFEAGREGIELLKRWRVFGFKTVGSYGFTAAANVVARQSGLDRVRVRRAMAFLRCGTR